MAASAHTLLIGDDAALRAMLRFLLRQDGCTVHEIARLEPQTALPPAPRLALVLLIVPRTDMAVAPVLTRLRRLGYQVPTIILAYAVTRELRRQALALGAHDVISLPLPTSELQARLRAVLRIEASPPEATPGSRVQAGGLVLDMASRTLSDGGAWSARLTQQEVQVLSLLMQRPGDLVKRADLESQVAAGRAVGEGALDTLLHRLRRKLRRPPSQTAYIRTVRGQGYVFDARAAVRVARVGAPHVLVVDDDAAIRTLIREVLEGEGYRVSGTAGADGVRLARQLRPAVVVLDVHMPDMDGVTVRRHLESDPRTAGIPVIGLSDSTTLRARLDALQAEDFLSKPFATDDLVLRVRKWAGPPR